MKLLLDDRPIVVAIAGPNGAGKTTFYEVHLRSAGLRLVNADVLARDLGIEAYPAARLAGAVRTQLLDSGESFAFETVFSDPVGEKLGFLQDAATRGYAVVLCFVGVSSPRISEQRVAMRVSQGGHDVPTEKLVERFPRILKNLRSAVGVLPHVWVFDNDDLRTPFRLLAVFEDGQSARAHRPWPAWFARVMAKT